MGTGVSSIPVCLGVVPTGACRFAALAGQGALTVIVAVPMAAIVEPAVKPSRGPLPETEFPPVVDAMIVTVPGATAETNPVLVTVAIAGSPEDHRNVGLPLGGFS